MIKVFCSKFSKHSHLGNDNTAVVKMNMLHLIGEHFMMLNSVTIMGAYVRL